MPKILMPYTVHLDHTLRVTPLSTLFAKGDSAAHRFEMTILRAGVQDNLTGCTVFGKFYRMADSTVVSMPGTVEDGKAVVVLDAACYDYIGRFALTIAIQKGEEETTVFYGDGYMHGQNAETAISGEYIIYDINTLLEKISEINAATKAAKTATSNANTATGKANTAANTANTAATNANTAKDAANAAAGKIDNMTVSATPVSTGTATAELSTVDGHYHLALGLPKGDTGATPQISVQVQTGAAGSEAQVSVTGTAENPVIHLTIPRGDVGEIGNLTINGKAPDGSGAVTLTAADVGALATGGTATDSSKLGGKPPEYYAKKDEFENLSGRVASYVQFQFQDITIPKGNGFLNIPFLSNQLTFLNEQRALGRIIIVGSCSSFSTDGIIVQTPYPIVASNATNIRFKYINQNNTDTTAQLRIVLIAAESCPIINS